MMSNTAGKPYRVVARKTAVALTVLVVGLCTLAMWLGLNWVELYSDQMSDLIDSNPDQARVRLIGDIRLIAFAAGSSVWALAAFMFWYGLRSLRTQSMPPKGSWVIEGQKIRTGPGTIFHAKLLLVMSALLFLLGIVAATALWHVLIALLTSD